MADLTVASFEMEPIYDGIAGRARATLGVSAFGMQVMTLPADWGGYPNHRHDASVEDANRRRLAPGFMSFTRPRSTKPWLRPSRVRGGSIRVALAHRLASRPYTQDLPGRRDFVAVRYPA